MQLAGYSQCGQHLPLNWSEKPQKKQGETEQNRALDVLHELQQGKQKREDYEELQLLTWILKKLFRAFEEWEQPSRRKKCEGGQLGRSTELLTKARGVVPIEQRIKGRAALLCARKSTSRSLQIRAGSHRDYHR